MHHICLTPDAGHVLRCVCTICAYARASARASDRKQSHKRACDCHTQSVSTGWGTGKEGGEQGRVKARTT